ncbi:MAG: DUF4037 domain-containing protein [Anaerovoracaceae bacterium]
MWSGSGYRTLSGNCNKRRVFVDHLGTFSQIRSALKAFYPEDVLKKKLAARCAVMAQAGQYNYGRCMKRGDSQAAYLACGEFIRTAMSCRLSAQRSIHAVL